jgi:plasmid stabilization system protein ParE
MKYIVSLTQRAEQDRESAFQWYASHYSEAFAVRWYNGITRAMRTLQRDPKRCHKAHENDSFSFDLYELIYGKRRSKHRILFRIYKDVVLILHVRHSAQRDLTEEDL